MTLVGRPFWQGAPAGELDPNPAKAVRAPDRNAADAAIAVAVAALAPASTAAAASTADTAAATAVICSLSFGACTNLKVYSTPTSSIFPRLDPMSADRICFNRW